MKAQAESSVFANRRDGLIVPEITADALAGEIRQPWFVAHVQCDPGACGKASACGHAADLDDEEDTGDEGERSEDSDV